MSTYNVLECEATREEDYDKILEILGPDADIINVRLRSNSKRMMMMLANQTLGKFWMPSQNPGRELPDVDWEERVLQQRLHEGRQ